MGVDRDLMQLVAEEVAQGATIEHLGTGGFASTFKVTASGEQPYALKVVDSAQSDAERSARELAALQRISHPNVVAYRDTGVVGHGGVTYRWLTMEYVDGTTLASLLRSGRTWTHLEAVQVLRQLVAGAAAIWAEQTSHRDLSPNNVLIDAAGRPVIVDLGLARHLDDTTITTLPTPGTPGWMSPEQVSDHPTHGDWRSDQFVLGVIGYTLAAGTPPFRYSTPFEAWRAPALQTPRAPRELDPTLPAALSDLLMKMMEKKPHRRYLRTDVLLADLDRVLAALAVASDSIDPGSDLSFYMAIGDIKTFAVVPGVMAAIAPDGLIVEPRSAGRVAELMGVVPRGQMTHLSDPLTHYARSPLGVRPAFFRDLPYGNAAEALTGFPHPVDREAFCMEVLESQLGGGLDIVMAPYFHAGLGETEWIRESLRCAQLTAELLSAQAPHRGGLIEPMWTTVAVASTWLAQEARRDELLTLLTSQPMETLQLLVSTTQQSFATLGDLPVLAGLSDVLTVMRDAGVPVVLSRRGPEGLLGLALGAAGWSTGVRAVLQNMKPHPEAAQRGGPAPDRIYVPQLLSTLTASTYQLLAAAEPDRMRLSTTYAEALLRQNPRLEAVGTEQRLLLLQHNAAAARQQVTELAQRSVPARAPYLRSVVEAAKSHFEALPAVGGSGESADFVDAWLEVL